MMFPSYSEDIWTMNIGTLVSIFGYYKIKSFI